MPAVRLSDFRKPTNHPADRTPLTGDQLAQRCREAVELALIETRAHVNSASEVDALAQEVALHALKRGVRDQTTGECVVASGAATLLSLTFHAKSKVVRGREWRDMAAGWKSRAKDGGARVETADPELLESPETDHGSELSRAINAQAQRAHQRGEDMNPGAIMRALDGLTARLAERAEWTEAQTRRARIKLAVALDDRDATIALRDAAPNMAATSAANLASEGRQLLLALTPSVVAQALTEALADTASVLGGSLDESTDAVPRTSGRATLNITSHDRAPDPQPVTYRTTTRRPGSTCTRPRRTPAEDVTAYLLATEARGDQRDQRAGRVKRIAERAEMKHQRAHAGTNSDAATLAALAAIDAAGSENS